MEHSSWIACWFGKVFGEVSWEIEWESGRSRERELDRGEGVLIFRERNEGEEWEKTAP